LHLVLRLRGGGGPGVLKLINQRTKEKLDFRPKGESNMIDLQRLKDTIAQSLSIESD